jgi:hypothetical protein
MQWIRFSSIVLVFLWNIKGSCGLTAQTRQNPQESQATSPESQQHADEYPQVQYGPQNTLKTEGIPTPSHDSLSIESCFQRAEQHFTEGNYTDALDEYLHLEELMPGQTQVRTAILDLCQKTGDYSAGMQSFESWEYAAANLPVELRKEYLGLAFLSHDFDALRGKLDGGLGLKEPEKTQLRLHLALYEGEWDRARKLYERFEIQHVARARSAFQPAMSAMEGMRFKKPAVAGLLSVIPGLGQVYAGNYVGGFLTSAGMGILGMATLYYAQQDSDRKAPQIILGGLGLGLYTFNFVLAIRSAHRYNERLRQNFLEGMDQLTLRMF